MTTTYQGRKEMAKKIKEGITYSARELVEVVNRRGIRVPVLYKLIGMLNDHYDKFIWNIVEGSLVVRERK